MKSQIELKDYRDAVQLDTPYKRRSGELSPAQREEIVDLVLKFLVHERHDPSQQLLSGNFAEKRRALEGLLTMRPPGGFPGELLCAMDQLLAAEARERKTFDPLHGMQNSSTPLLWQGDITALKVGAIVNAANNALLGCFQPFHKCIDNIIHDKAGPRLRQDCGIIMDLQGEPEETGRAKITRAYNLPSKFVLHTVGPILSRGEPSAEDERLLQSCYRSCLELAAQLVHVHSVAFCCISTGVFGYPKDKAALAAIRSVKEWIIENPGRMDGIVFNVFDNRDHEIYEHYLEEYESI